MAKGFTGVPTWLMIAIYISFVLALLFFTDMLTFIVGALALTLVFANGYDRTHPEEH